MRTITKSNVLHRNDEDFYEALQYGVLPTEYDRHLMEKTFGEPSGIIDDEFVSDVYEFACTYDKMSFRCWIEHVKYGNCYKLFMLPELRENAATVLMDIADICNVDNFIKVVRNADSFITMA